MRCLCIALYTALGFIPLNSFGIQPPKQKYSVVDDLKTYYDSKRLPPLFDESLKNITSKDAIERQFAVTYLRDLLTQALTDELAGEAGWEATPFFGGGGINVAAKPREWTLKALLKADSSPEIISLVEWFVREEKKESFQSEAMKSLERVDMDSATKLRLAVMEQPHPNSLVLTAALTQSLALKTKVQADKLADLCHNPRQNVRDAARKLNQQLGGMDPSPFDAVKAMESPQIRKLMEAIGHFLLERPPEKAEFGLLSVQERGGSWSSWTLDAGWILKKDGNRVTVLTPAGKHVEALITDRKTNDQIAIFETVPVDKAVLGDSRLAKSGERYISMYRIGLSHWLYKQKRFELASQALLPGLDLAPSDDAIIDFVHWTCGQVLGRSMLVAFVGERDFAEAQRLAARLAKNYPKTFLHYYATRLAEELPKRQDDFKKLKLPTAAEWAELKKKMSRKEQVEFLCQRLRLLNCFQWGQPASYSINEKQFAEPCGISDDAAWGLLRGKTEVINPLVELVGPVYHLGLASVKQLQGLELGVPDIPALAPFLEDDWHLLCVSFWRDFHYARDLDTTRPIIARIINDVAKEEVCDVRKLAKMNREEREKEIARIVQWAKDKR